MKLNLLKVLIPQRPEDNFLEPPEMKDSNFQFALDALVANNNYRVELNIARLCYFYN
jgi:hypothetical protein